MAIVNQDGQTLESVLPNIGKPWYKVPHLLKLNLVIIFGVFFSSTNNGYESALLNGFQSMPMWRNYIGNPQGAILGALINGMTLGSMLSLFVVPAFADRFGRKPSIILGCVIVIIASIIQCGAQSYAMFFVARIILGIGIPFCQVTSPTLISEVAYPTHRFILTSTYNSLWYLGAIIAAWVTYGTYWISDSTWSWRIPSIVQGAAPMIQLFLVYFIPESPRYLVSRGRIDDARKVLVQHHAGGDENSPLVEFELAEISATLEYEKSVSSTSYREFFTTRANFHRFFIVTMYPFMMQMSGNGLVSYYLNKVLDSIGITSAPEQLRINGYLMLYDFIVSCSLAALAGKVRRRPMFFACFGGMLTTYVIWTVLSALNQQRDFKDHSLARGVLAMIFLYYAAYGCALNGLPFLYMTEILPYHLRAKGISISQVATNLVIIFNGFVNPVAMDAITWRYYIVYCCIIAAELVIVYFAFPETYGHTLESVRQVFENSSGSLDDEKQVISHNEYAGDE